MKFILTDCTGSIGSEVLSQCILNAADETLEIGYPLSFGNGPEGVGLPLNGMDS